MCESEWYNGDDNLSQFVSDSKIVEAHLKMLAKAKLDTKSQAEEVQKAIALFGPDKQLDADIAAAQMEANMETETREMVIRGRIKTETDRLVKDALREAAEEEDENRDEAGQFTLSKIDPLLLSILSHRRPHATVTEEKFITSWIDTVKGMKCDAFGNRYIRIGDAPVMWSCHTDTVHSDEGFQNIVVKDDFVGLTKRERKGTRGWRSCLGADDGAGIYLALKMIERGVQGMYVFHRGEEIGGLGSGWAAINAEKDFFEDITMAIALDRKGYDSVITFQGSRCCSNKFAQALADQLGGDFKPDSTGLFTDTANYTSIVPECTNLSVGYFRQHGPSECQNYKFLDALLEQLCEVDVNVLPIERDINDHSYSWDRHSNYSAYSQWGKEFTPGSGWDDEDDATGGVVGHQETNTYDYRKKGTHEYPLNETGGMGDNYNGREYDELEAMGYRDVWDDDPNNPDNPDQWEAAERREIIEMQGAMDRDNANENEEIMDPNNPKSEAYGHRFKMFKIACQEFPALVADILQEQNVTIQEFIELDPWAATALLMETDLEEEDLAALIEDEAYETYGDPDDDPAF